MFWLTGIWLFVGSILLISWDYCQTGKNIDFFQLGAFGIISSLGSWIFGYGLTFTGCPICKRFVKSEPEIRISTPTVERVIADGVKMGINEALNNL